MFSIVLQWILLSSALLYISYLFTKKDAQNVRIWKGAVWIHCSSAKYSRWSKFDFLVILFSSQEAAQGHKQINRKKLAKRYPWHFITACKRVISWYHYLINFLCLHTRNIYQCIHLDLFLYFTEWSDVEHYGLIILLCYHHYNSTTDANPLIIWCWNLMLPITTLNFQQLLISCRIMANKSSLTL